MVQLSLVETQYATRKPSHEELHIQRGSQNYFIYEYLAARAGRWVSALELVHCCEDGEPVWKLTSRISEIREAIRSLGGDLVNDMPERGRRPKSVYMITLPLADREAVG